MVEVNRCPRSYQGFQLIFSTPRLHFLSKSTTVHRGRCSSWLVKLRLVFLQLPRLIAVTVVVSTVFRNSNKCLQLSQSSSFTSFEQLSLFELGRSRKVGHTIINMLCGRINSTFLHRQLAVNQRINAQLIITPTTNQSVAFLVMNEHIKKLFLMTETFT